MAAYEQATTSDPLQTPAWLGWSEILLKQKRFLDAAAVLGKAREQLPKNATLAKMQGDALLGRHDDKRALEAYENAVALESGLEASLALRLKQLRKKFASVSAQFTPSIR